MAHATTSGYLTTVFEACIGKNFRANQQAPGNSAMTGTRAHGPRA